MAERIVTDATGRTWTCTAAAPAGGGAVHEGQDVALTCVSPAAEAPVTITVGWQWERMAPNGLARLIADASPAPRR